MVLISPVQEMVKKCDQTVLDHEQYVENYEACREWLSHAQVKLQPCMDTSGTKEQLDNKQQQLQVS